MSFYTRAGPSGPPASPELFNPQILHAVLRELVRQTVEDTLNGLLEEEADDLVGAERHGRTAGREAYRAGHYDRKLVT
ncbi:MAG: transposase, partial [Kiritimatiellae bacterium]|nr:transposase [Kiritimatiellia bacterium]